MHLPLSGLHYRSKQATKPTSHRVGGHSYLGEINNSLGTVNNHGSVINQSGITNHEDANFNNYGRLLTELSFNSSLIFNRGYFTNFGYLYIDSGGAIFDLDNFGLLYERCGSTYEGSDPINNDHDGITVEFCQVIFEDGFE